MKLKREGWNGQSLSRSANDKPKSSMWFDSIRFKLIFFSFDFDLHFDFEQMFNIFVTQLN